LAGAKDPADCGLTRQNLRRLIDRRSKKPEPRSEGTGQGASWLLLSRCRSVDVGPAAVTISSYSQRHNSRTEKRTAKATKTAKVQAKCILASPSWRFQMRKDLCRYP
jgi:hypothetical protein